MSNALPYPDHREAGLTPVVRAQRYDVALELYMLRYIKWWQSPGMESDDPPEAPHGVNAYVQGEIRRAANVASSALSLARHAEFGRGA